MSANFKQDFQSTNVLTRDTGIQNKCMDIKEEKGGEMNWEIEINI